MITSLSSKVKWPLLMYLPNDLGDVDLGRERRGDLSKLNECRLEVLGHLRSDHFGSREVGLCLLPNAHEEQARDFMTGGQATTSMEACLLRTSNIDHRRDLPGSSHCPTTCVPMKGSLPVPSEGNTV